jgi:reductive dehalogenase
VTSQRPDKHPLDKEAGFEVSENFKRFSQKNEVFCRTAWDDELKSKKAADFFQGYIMPKARARRADGFTQKDYSLRNAAWHMATFLRMQKLESESRSEGFQDYFTLYEEGWPEKFPVGTPADAAETIKNAAIMLGADLVGICELDNRWVYSEKFVRPGPRPELQKLDTQSLTMDLPEHMTHVVVMATKMPLDLNRTVPSALSGAASGIGYSHDASLTISVSQFIRNLGYEAYGSMNDTAVSIPLAIQAGLAEYSRAGLAITPEFGPRVRISKVFTNFEMTVDKPIRFGVKEFCEMCNKCATNCPPQAIAHGGPTEALNISNHQGIKKWNTDGEKCFKFWASQNSECSICIRVCPYNRTFNTVYDKFWLFLTKTPLRRLALVLDNIGNSHTSKKSAWWWKVRNKDKRRYSSLN